MKRLLALVAALLLLPMHASAEDTVWTLVTEAGERITVSPSEATDFAFPTASCMSDVVSTVPSK